MAVIQADSPETGYHWKSSKSNGCQKALLST
jgi:hypothetical protein